MSGGPESRRTSAAWLIPVVFIALAVLVLALVIRGNETGTIVVEKLTLTGTNRGTSPSGHVGPYSFTEITEASADGIEQRQLTSSSTSRPGFQELTAGQELELYDPVDHTVYETTQAAWQHAIDREMQASSGVSGVSRGQVVRLSSTVVFAPGRESIFEQQLLAHQLRLAGRTTIDGKPALKLVQPQPMRFGKPGNGPSDTTADTDYVSPGSFHPIEQLIRSSFDEGQEAQTLIYHWQTYRVLPATARHQWLVSLTARHPGARVINSAPAFIRASEQQQRSPQA